MGRKRVLDSTPLYDAVATMDTINLIRSAIRNLLKVADKSLKDSLVKVLTSGDDYASSAKPQVDWDDAAARADLVDSRTKDAYACLVELEGRELLEAASEAARLLGIVVGQDLEEDTNGVFRIVRKVAKDRVISVVDPEARHGHKTSSRRFDGYKGNIALDPESDIITKTVVTAGNASVAEELIEDLLKGDDARDVDSENPISESQSSCVYGDSSYGTGQFQPRLEAAHMNSKCKTQPPNAKEGLNNPGFLGDSYS